MSRDILPVFGGLSEEAARAMSEPFFQPEQFTVGIHGESPQLDPESLVAIGTTFLGPREVPQATKKFALGIAPDLPITTQEAAELFLDGFRSHVVPFQDIFDEFRSQPKPTPELLLQLCAMGLDIPNCSRLRNVASFAVVDTAEGYLAQLVVPKSVGTELGMAFRQGILSPSSMKAASEAAKLPKEHRRIYRTLSPMIHSFGLIIGAQMLPRPTTIKRSLDDFVARQS